MTNKKNENAMGQLIRICILGWSAALLTASYAGTLSKMDPTFIATVFTASAATFLAPLAWWRSVNHLHF